MADGGTRTHFVGVRLTAAELQAVDALAGRDGASRAHVLRGAALREAKAAPDGGADAATLEAENRILRGQVEELRARLDDAGSHGAPGFLRRLLGR